MRDVGKSSFVEAMSTRKDSVFEKVIQELTFLENVYSTDVKIVYHPSCYRSYMSKRNCQVFKVEHNLTDPAEYPYDKQYENKLNKVQTRSLLPTVTVDINTCFLCKKKTFKKDRKLHKMESRDRVKKIAKCAEESNDLSMMKIIESDGFIERAVYHNGCATNYLLKLKPAKTSKNNDESVHDIAFSSLVSSIHDDLLLQKKAFLISYLLDKYRSFLPNGVPDTYPSAKLQAKLLGHFGDRITIQPQRGQGMSNIMFSSCLTIGDAIAAAGKLKSMLRLTEIEHS